MDTANVNNRVCPVELAGQLDSGLRRFLQNPDRILRSYIHPGMTVLDLGCGPGFFTMAIARLLNGRGKVVASDVQQGMLDIVKRKIIGTSLEPLIDLHLSGDGSFSPEISADFILAFYVIHEIPDHNGLFRELRSRIAPGGKLFISEPAFHVTGKQIRKMIKELESNGFKVVTRPFLAMSRTLVAIPV